MIDSLREQMRTLDIPYPQKKLLELEVLQDAEEIFPEVINTLSRDDIRELEQIHSTRINRWLNVFSQETRKSVEISFAFFPLVTVFTFIIKEENMMNFIREGGAGMYLILLIGLFLLGQEALKAFRLLVIRKHTRNNLEIDTTSVLLGCLALMFIGIGWTFFGFYISATYVAQSNASTEILLLGAKESLTPLILSSLLSTLIVLTHYGVRKTMLVWRAPVA